MSGPREGCCVSRASCRPSCRRRYGRSSPPVSRPCMLPCVLPRLSHFPPGACCASLLLARPPLRCLSAASSFTLPCPAAAAPLPFVDGPGVPALRFLGLGASPSLGGGRILSCLGCDPHFPLFWGFVPTGSLSMCLQSAAGWCPGGGGSAHGAGRHCGLFPPQVYSLKAFIKRNTCTSSENSEGISQPV